MRERPILFSGPMIRAILEGRKTQTRRLAKYWVGEGTRARMHACEMAPGVASCPYGVPGDRLWVRETWMQMLVADGGALIDRAFYAADGEGPRNHRGEIPRWRPSIYMPRWASRITLEITDVRVERLQDISEEDADAEGVMSLDNIHPIACARSVFEEWWDEINGKRAPWYSNPWVWVVSFRRQPPAAGGEGE